jgi:diguanylate cyclase (GGDEF)-like protein
MHRLSPAALVYVCAVALAGAVTLGHGLRALDVGALPFFAVLVALSGGAAFLQLRLPLGRTRGSSVAVPWAIDLAALVVLGPDAALAVAAVGGWAQSAFQARSRTPVHVTLVTIGTCVLGVRTAAVIFEALGGIPGSAPGDLLIYAEAIAGAALAQLAVNSTLPAILIALSTRQSGRRLWHDKLCWAAPGYLMAVACFSVSALFVLQAHYLLALVTLTPLYLLHRVSGIILGRMADAAQRTDDASDLQLATIEALASAIDARDYRSQSHLRRVVIFAEGLGRACGLNDLELQGLKTAAVLHDIGHLAVPEHILSKPGPLTQEEFQRVRIHPQVGADLIRRVPFPYPVAPLIASHHERWDGRGYPKGLVNEEIPLGARILSVADYYDALVSDRPYHRAHSREAAIALLGQESGRALDPNLVRKFLEVLPLLEARVASAATAHDSPGSGPRDAGRQDRGGWAFNHIARAHREIHALYEVAQTLGASLGVAETMQEVSSKLMNLVPFSACALFLCDEDSQSLICRYATGTDARILERLMIPFGRGVTGWVVRTRRPIVNGLPSADVEAAGLGHALSLHSALVCPLVAQDRLIGTLAVYHATPEFFSEDDRRLLERVADQTAAVIVNSITFEQTQADSLTDPLTGLPNSRAMFTQITRELARADRLQSSVSVLLMDVDHFKEINDTFGHGAGDRALRDAAAVLRSCIRPYDSCGRYAGDEFIVVLPGCDRVEAEIKRRELQHALDVLTIETREGQPVHLAVSAGAATYPDDGTTDETLLAAADRRMYQDKADRKLRWPERGAPHAGTAASPETIVRH